MDDKIVDNSGATAPNTMGVRVFLAYRADLKAHVQGLSNNEITMVAAHLAAAEVGAMLGVTMMRQPGIAVPGGDMPHFKLGGR